MSNIASISKLKQALDTGARANLFRITPTFGSGLLGDTNSTDATERFSFLCKAAQLPGSTVGVIEVPFVAGRRLKIGGDRTFAEWTTTILNDRDQKIRAFLESIQEVFATTDYEQTFKGTADASELNIENGTLSTMTVEQLDQAGNAINTYVLENCWPTDISTIDLSYDSTDVIEEFTVTWAYDFFTSTGTQTNE